MDRNKMLLDFASDWTLDGDLLRCRECERAQIASRQDEDFVHRIDCKNRRIGGRPWSVLQAILLTLPSGVSVVDQLAAVTAQRDELLTAICNVVPGLGVYEDWDECTDDDVGHLKRLVRSIARAQPEQPQQPKEEP
jgi:hypothetical protein